MNNPILLTLNELRAKGYKIELIRDDYRTRYKCFSPGGIYLNTFDTLPEMLSTLNEYEQSDAIPHS